MTEPLGGAAGGRFRWAIGRRGIVVLALLTAGGLAAASSSTWLEVLAWTPLEEAAVAVPGTRAAPTVGAAAFVVAAGAVSLALARGRGRLVASAGIGLGGVLAAVSTAMVLMDPDVVAATAARSAVGVGVTAGPPAMTVAPWLALALGVLAVVLTVIALFASGGWSPPTARHDGVGEAQAAEEGDPTDQWDALSRGEDPTA